MSERRNAVAIDAMGSEGGTAVCVQGALDYLKIALDYDPANVGSTTASLGMIPPMGVGSVTPTSNLIVSCGFQDRVSVPA